MAFKKPFLFILGFLAVISLGAEYFKTAVISSLGAPQSEILFTIHSVENPEQNFVEATYKDLEGNVVIRETSIQEGLELKKYTVDNFQEFYKAEVFPLDDKLHFQLEKNGVKKISREPYSENCVSVGTLIPFIRTRWDEIKSGGRVEVRLIVPDRLETIRFLISLDDSAETVPADGEVVLKMRPAAFLVSLVLDPIYLKLNSDASKILSMTGRVLPMKFMDGKLHTLDAHVTYSYE